MYIISSTLNKLSIHDLQFEIKNCTGIDHKSTERKQKHIDNYASDIMVPKRGSKHQNMNSLCLIPHYSKLCIA